MISADIQKLEQDAIVELYVFDTTVIGGTDKFYFHAGTNGLQVPVIWQTLQYQPYAIQVQGFELTGKGTLPRPTLSMGNQSGIMFAVNQQYDDLVGAMVTRHRTFAMYLDGMPSADPTQFLPDDVYYVEKKSKESKKQVSYELASAMDLQGFQLPSRVITTNYCPWKYRGPECSYTGTAKFTVLNVSTQDPNLDVCSKTTTGCKCRFGANGVLPFGGFPASKAYNF